ncbi:MAG: bifunctional demethylmenaquinone methyltransferase/2-methoxy-6-polyprenyl-1,4-benzoquinol methylase UbiE [Bacteroidetes bacterium]|nr:MAG: bifunctional demethylmenaquinone methyltransferase/2-methoxy-6-polyprenyl-1,4-benzoquinol methylase UbiE [Bacteroidota bacterium]
MNQVTPYKTNESKKQQVSAMFNNIAPKYDLLNHVLSAGIDILWRKKAVKKLKPFHPEIILDVATGTGDFAIEAAKLHPKKIIGIDISEKMLQIGEEKLRKNNLEKLIELQVADSENLPFQDNSFDAITVAFGVRNFENLEKGLSEMLRVLRPGGIAAIIEFAQPEAFPVKQVYNFYFKHILPNIGKIISKDAAAYTYLPESVEVFPYGQNFTQILEKTGFHSAVYQPLTFGIAHLYTAEKVLLQKN